MKRNHRKGLKKAKKNHKRHLSFLEVVRLFDGMPVII